MQPRKCIIAGYTLNTLLTRHVDQSVIYLWLVGLVNSPQILLKIKLHTWKQCIIHMFVFVSIRINKLIGILTIWWMLTYRSGECSRQQREKVTDFTFNTADVWPADFAGHQSGAKWGTREEEEKKWTRTGRFTSSQATAGPGPTLGWRISSLLFHTHTRAHTQMFLDPNDMKLARTLPRPHEERWKEGRGRNTEMNSK